MTSKQQSTAVLVDIVCPYCGQVVAADADRCPHCERSTAADPTQALPTKRLTDRPWLIVLMILHVGCLGIPLYWRTRYSLAVRMLLVAVSVIYTVLTVVGIIWGCAYILRMLRGG
jgi:hypothetical protein